MGTHLKGGEFQSDKYPTCPAGKVPLSTKDPMAQDLLWEYAQRRRAVDAEFSGDLETALIAKGFDFVGGPSQRMWPRSPIPMRLHCPECCALHIDEGEFATKPHHTHACQTCGNVWRPAVVETVGVKFLPGFKNAPAVDCERVEVILGGKTRIWSWPFELNDAERKDVMREQKVVRDGGSSEELDRLGKLKTHWWPA